MNIIKRKEKLIAELREKEYRDAFISEHIDTGIPFQIRALREQRRWKQEKLAALMGVSQAWISKIEDPNHPGYSIKTLLKIASIFDVGLIVRFAPFSDFIKWELELSPESLQVPSFDEEYLEPPVTRVTAQGGISVGGEAIARFINPSQDKPEPLQADRMTMATVTGISEPIKFGIQEPIQATGTSRSTVAEISKSKKAEQKKLLQFTMPRQDTGEQYNEAVGG